MRRIVQIDRQFPDEAILETAAALLKSGGVVIYPTDTTYAIGVNGTDVEAILKLFSLKGRSFDKPVHVIVSDFDMAERYVILNKYAKTLAEKFLPGPLTLILPKKESIPEILVGGHSTLGIRIPDSKVCSILANKCGIPFTTTSANISGWENPYSVDQILKQFGNRIEQIDMILDQGQLGQKTPSTLVDLTCTPPTILREGPISSDDVLHALGF